MAVLSLMVQLMRGLHEDTTGHRGGVSRPFNKSAENITHDAGCDYWRLCGGDHASGGAGNSVDG